MRYMCCIFVMKSEFIDYSDVINHPNWVIQESYNGGPPMDRRDPELT